MKNRNIFWGLMFLCIAAFVIFNNFGWFSDVNLFGILITVVLLYCILKSIRPLHFGGILFPLAFLCIIYADALNLEQITPWPVLAAALFGTIGLSIIFPQHHYYGSCGDGRFFGWNGDFETVDHVNDADVNCSVSFAGSTKYVDTDDFKQACLKCSFGSLKVFFDHAVINGDHARIYVNSSFGETELYLPKEWNVVNHMSASFGDVQEIHKITHAGMPTVEVTGNVSFGDCKIFYI